MIVGSEGVIAGKVSIAGIVGVVEGGSGDERAGLFDIARNEKWEN